MRRIVRAVASTVLVATWMRFSEPVGAEDAAPSESTASCEGLEAMALAFHPMLHRDSARIAASKAREHASGRLDAPELQYQQWAVPLARPYALNQANMIMLGVRQRIRLGDVREAEREIERAATHTEQSLRAITREELLRELRLANVAYARAYEERALHVAHAALVSETLGLAEIAYGSGLTSQAALLEGRAMLAELQAEIGAIDADLDNARLSLNALTGRDLDAEVGPPCTMQTPAVQPSAAPLPEPDNKPELQVATQRVNERRARLALEQRRLNTPELMVGVDYMAMPDSGQPFGYGAMVSMSLPWLQAGRKSSEKAATLALRESEIERGFAERVAQVDVRRALVSARAADATRRSIEGELLPAALQRCEALRIALTSDQARASDVLAALSDLLNARIALVRAGARQREAQIELARALGSTAPAQRTAGRSP